MAFTFFDENQDMVIVTMRDSLDSSNLGYKYADVSESDHLWINYEPLPPHKPSEPWNPSLQWFPSLTTPSVRFPQALSWSAALLQRDLKGKGLKYMNQLQEDILLEKSVGQALRRLGIADWNTDIVVTICF
ncbi:hypothetical protein AXG93_4139s1010 [Marchantia polymorpha subsp. ruderalis]|uniref:Polyphenol oxidase central domain-containing protein n=1 Tax=Marchantia polymorpha subsp. ruderalis TaxID=1480154 RepID=A0A176VPL6_MARPO|nr:hypothetical protein AXG93_4139s1010 [Marchantia polymorpha subsp. ruderalis]